MTLVLTLCGLKCVYICDSRAPREELYRVGWQLCPATECRERVVSEFYWVTQRSVPDFKPASGAAPQHDSYLIKFDKKSALFTSKSPKKFLAALGGGEADLHTLKKLTLQVTDLTVTVAGAACHTF